MTDLFQSKVTIYNDIPATAVTPRRFERFVIDRCNIQSGKVSTADGTIIDVVNATTVVTKDISKYKSPNEYINTPIDLREKYYTVQVGDFVVFEDVNDVVETPQQWQHLLTKYAHNGMKVTSVSPNIYGMSVDNISFTNA